VIEKRTESNVSIYGQVYKVRRPTVLEASKIRTDLRDKTEDEQLQSAINFLESLGVPRSVCQELELDHFTKIVDFVLSSKKN
jgi:hypothetical protein